MGLQVAGDVGRAEHLSADATGDFAFVSDHVGSESVFGGKSGGTSLRGRKRRRWGFSGTDGGRVRTARYPTYRDLTFKRSFRGMHMFDMAAQMVWPAQRETRLHLGLKLLPLSSQPRERKDVLCWL